MNEHSKEYKDHVLHMIEANQDVITKIDLVIENEDFDYEYRQRLLKARCEAIDFLVDLTRIRDDIDRTEKELLTFGMTIEQMIEQFQIECTDGDSLTWAVVQLHEASKANNRGNGEAVEMCIARAAWFIRNNPERL